MTGYLLHLLRHGTPKTPGLLMGSTDGMPTEAGIAACVNRVANLEVEVLISSDLARTRMAAEAIAKRANHPLQINPRWRELDFGQWDGSAPSQIDSTALALFYENPDQNPPPEGEHWATLTNRIDSAITNLLPRPTLVITHGGPMRAALAVLCGFDHRQVWSFALPYASLLTLRVWPGEQTSAQIIGLSA